MQAELNRSEDDTYIPLSTRSEDLALSDVSRDVIASQCRDNYSPSYDTISCGMIDVLSQHLPPLTHRGRRIRHEATNTWSQSTNLLCHTTSVDIHIQVDLSKQVRKQLVMVIVNRGHVLLKRDFLVNHWCDI
jgi:hypothetical protein